MSKEERKKGSGKSKEFAAQALRLRPSCRIQRIGNTGLIECLERPKRGCEFEMKFGNHWFCSHPGATETAACSRVAARK